ncbi:MAG: restriction endonuclease subunit S, partial [Candidatus Nanoarchaeia archaeon]
PFETMRNHGGDCEDAILLFHALLPANYNEGEVVWGFVHDLEKKTNFPHVWFQLYDKNRNRIIKEYDRLGFTIYENNLKDGILIPRYYDPDTKKELEKLRKTGKYDMRKIEDLIKEKVIKIKGAGGTVSSREYNIYDDIPFLRTSDVGAWETRNYSVQNVNEETYLKYKEKQKLKEGDILFIKDGTYRIGETLILTKYDLKMLVQSHFKIIRSLNKKELDPYLLLYLLNTPIVRKQIDERTFVQATISTVGDRLKDVTLPIPKSKFLRDKKAKEMRDKIVKRAELKYDINQMFHTKLES